METTIAQRFEAVIKALKMNNNSFAKSINVSSTAIIRVTNGDNDPGFKMLNSTLDNYPNINPDWLLRGEGEMFKTEQSISPDTKLWEKVIDRYEKTIEDLRYTISLQRQLMGKLSPVPMRPSAGKVITFFPNYEGKKIMAAEA
ncbi:hypothetical protein VB264_16930 [Arcicella aquatica]|uniref:HTH cro/C1-type domain-containing protein n=1 Tax=Arcicella aquatica TaxID=217141 RepID=A0ABU5QQX8_9BACT|nr:hypothetical protein [Arcicella aquatica]MEA5259486.1 hypothetical protein [Arcicella aquatica]